MSKRKSKTNNFEFYLLLVLVLIVAYILYTNKNCPSCTCTESS